MAGMNGLIALWQSLPLPWRRWRIVGQVEVADEVAERLAYGGVVLVGTPKRTAWAVFDCPCRTGHRLMLNLDTTRYPVWRIESTRPLTIRPSIDGSTPERRCHFFVHNGKISWAKTTNGD